MICDRRYQQLGTDPEQRNQRPYHSLGSSANSPSRSVSTVHSMLPVLFFSATEKCPSLFTFIQAPHGHRRDDRGPHPLGPPDGHKTIHRMSHIPPTAPRSSPQSRTPTTAPSMSKISRPRPRLRKPTTRLASITASSLSMSSTRCGNGSAARNSKHTTASRIMSVAALDSAPEDAHRLP